MNDDLIEVKKLKPFTKFIYTIGELPSSYLMSMTYEEQLIWFCNYLSQTVIPSVNNNAEALIELQEYVKNYFDNLDVQEEINQKLDEMAEDGSLLALIKSYVDPIYSSYEERINDEIAGQNAILNNHNEEINNLYDEISNQNAILDNYNEEIDNINQKVDSAVSGSPLVASSTAGMTDTTRVYVNTTDGHWYYYDGEDWQDGGVYQATEDSETVEELEDKMDEITELNKNLYANDNVNKDVTDTAYVQVNLDNPLPAGTYTLSAVVRSTSTAHDVIKTKFRLRDADGTTLQDVQINVGYPNRTSATFTISEPCTNIRFYGSTGSTSEYFVDTATYTNIQIENGSVATKYIPYGLTAIDTVSREQIEILRNKIKYVSTTGNDTNSGNYNSPLATMSKAIELGANTIILENGVYTENLKHTSVKKLTIIGNGSTIRYSNGSLACMEIRVSEVNIKDIIFDATGTEGTMYALFLRDCSGTVTNCKCINSSSMGFKLDGSNVTLTRCEAYNNVVDGFNAHDSTNNISDCTFIDCFSHNNGDDGLSFHENGKIHVHGGKYYNNTSTGIAPHNGCNCEIIGAYIHDNGTGIECFNTDGNYDPYPTMVCSGCIITDNTSEDSARGYGISAKYYNAIINATAIDGNQKGTVNQDGHSNIVIY